MKIRLQFLITTAALTFAAAATAADAPVASAPATPAGPDESVLGEMIITSSTVEKLPRIAVLPSLSPDYEDVIVRGVVRRDFELTGLFDVIPDEKAPPGMYGFEDAVDVDAWRKLGAEAIVKVAARRVGTDQIQVFGLAYLMSSGKKPVFEKSLTVKKTEARVTAHRITDALLGALTGRPGGFASELTFSGRWGKNRRIFRMDADGNGLLPLTDPKDTAIAPAFGPGNKIFYLVSHEYSPFSLATYSGQKNEAVGVPFKTSLYGVSLSKDGTKLALAVADNGRSAIFVGGADGSNMKSVSTTELATRPVFSPTGKLSWIGGEGKQGTQRVWLDGKAVSPAGFTAGGQTFCDTEDGVRLVYAVSVGGGKQDLVMGDEKGRVIGRLTQGQGSNTHPACSPDGRLLAFFSTRNGAPGIYVMSLKSFRTQAISSQTGEGLSWAALP
ncbi:MAG TPA: tolB protein [Polyangiaceae bacterium]|nr:tolB protein [Polyangiaceae bacterium]